MTQKDDTKKSCLWVSQVSTLLLFLHLCTKTCSLAFSITCCLGSSFSCCRLSRVARYALESLSLLSLLPGSFSLYVFCTGKKFVLIPVTDDGAWIGYQESDFPSSSYTSAWGVKKSEQEQEPETPPFLVFCLGFKRHLQSWDQTTKTSQLSVLSGQQQQKRYWMTSGGTGDSKLASSSSQILEEPWQDITSEDWHYDYRLSSKGESPLFTCNCAIFVISVSRSPWQRLFPWPRQDTLCT